MIRFLLRWFLVPVFILSTVGCQPRGVVSTSAGTTASSATIVSQRTYQVQEHLTLVNEGSAPPEKQNLWVALIRDIPPYQKVASVQISPANYKTITDEYGNQY